MFTSEWDKYFYRSTRKSLNPVFINKLGIKDSQILSAAEYGITEFRHKELTDFPSLVEQTFDAQHMKSIHEWLFQDLYKWAGKYRTVNMVKRSPDSGEKHLFALTENIDRYLKAASEVVHSTNWQELSKSLFVEKISLVFALINQGHPFREGNGRSSKIFLLHVSNLSPYKLDFNLVDPEQWNLASAQSAPKIGDFTPNPKAMHSVFEIISIERTEPVRTAAQTIEAKLGGKAKPQTRDDLKASLQSKLKSKKEARESKRSSDKSQDKLKKPTRNNTQHGR